MKIEVMAVSAILLLLSACQTQNAQKKNKTVNMMSHSTVDDHSYFLSEQAIASIQLLSSHPGYELFTQFGCVSCHGDQLQGSKQGPPLLHELYESSHHNNQRLYKSIQQGVHQHHWMFGDMPAFSNLTGQEIQYLVDYIRAMHRKNKPVWQALDN